MSTLEQAARQALEALEASTDWDVGAKGRQLQSMKAITALRSALEQPQQEPVAWWDDQNNDYSRVNRCGWKPLYTSPPAPRTEQQEPDIYPDEAYEMGLERIAYYTSPPAPRTEPVAWMMVNPTHLPSSRSLHWEPQDWHITWQAVPLYTAPPAPRKPLTFQEIDEVCKSVDPGEIEWLWSDLVKFARAIEARILGSKT